MSGNTSEKSSKEASHGTTIPTIESSQSPDRHPGSIPIASGKRTADLTAGDTFVLDEKDIPLVQAFLELRGILSRLRKECPWDREQTHDSLRPMLIEEAYEAIEAIEQKDYTELKKELGDLLLHILFHSELAVEEGSFTLEQVIRGESEKLIYRHPHVFGEVKVEGSEEVKKNWEQLKRREKGRNSVLDGVPAALPALQKAARVQDKASKVGFDWSDSPEGLLSVWKKVREELEEFEAEPITPDNISRRTDEFGDILFSLVNLARHEKIDAESALREATHKFEHRFRKLEKEVESTGRDFSTFTLDELDAIWDKVKKQ